MKKRLKIIIGLITIVAIIVLIISSSILTTNKTRTWNWWRNGYSNSTIQKVIGENISVQSNQVHIYFYQDIYGNKSCDKYIGAVIEDCTSIVCRYNSSSGKITYIDYRCIPIDENQKKAFRILASNGTNHGYYAGDNLVPCSIAEKDIYVCRIFYVDGWMMGHPSFGYANVAYNYGTIEYDIHVK